MKIGIITFHASYNCGSILQCMALKNILEEQGKEVDIINFSSVPQQNLYSVFYRQKTLKSLVKNMLCIPGYRIIKKHYTQYKEYIERVFNLKGAPFETSEQLKNSLPHYDMLIAGGDQIWNVKCDDFETTYFLDFAYDTYKISYAPSLGATNINLSPLKEEYKKLLMQFKALSCREVNGRNWLEELTGREVKLLPDPTLLLSANEWMEKIQEPFDSLPKEDFIFYYAFSYLRENNLIIEKIAEGLDIPVIVIDSKQWYIKRLSRYKKFVLCKETGPNAFLFLMKNAKYVMTTSFHGTVFSLIFNKQFLYLNSRNHEPTDDRTSFLLERLDLMSRYIYPEEVSYPKLGEKIDYTPVMKQIGLLRKSALEYLDFNIRKAVDNE